MIRPRYLLLLVVVIFECESASGAIFRCVGDSGVVLYSQFYCANVERVAEPRVSVIKAPALSEAERLSLKRIERASLALDQSSRKRVKRRRRQHEKYEAGKTILCREALAGLDDLRARKRGGYSLAESSALNAREAELGQQRALNC